MNSEILLMYSVVAFFYIISPGPAVFLAITNGIAGDMKSVGCSSFGNIIGLFVLSAISISGLGAIIIASATLFGVVKVIGAVYLIYMGIKQFRKNRQNFIECAQAEFSSNRSGYSYLKEGFFLAVTNPKPIIFFTALFPQFLDVDVAIAPQFFAMTGIFMFISFSSLYCYGYVSKTAKVLLRNQRGVDYFNRISGGIFIIMGIGLLQIRSANK